MALIFLSDLHDLLDSPTLLLFDCRHELSDVEAGLNAYQAGHVPGAHHLHLDRDLSGEILPGVTGRHPLPPAEVFARHMAAFDLDDGKEVVLYDDKGGGIAARAWWMLTGIGHANVRILNGGLPAYVAAGYPLEEGEVALPATDYRRRAAPYPALTYSHRTCDRAQLRFAGPDDWTIVDSRTAPRYRGEHEPIDPVAGHVPGADNRPWPGNLSADGTLLDAPQLKNRFAALGDEAERIVFYCGSGVTACHNLLAYYLATGKMAALYPGSWSDWITDPEAPVVTS